MATQGLGQQAVTPLMASITESANIAAKCIARYAKPKGCGPTLKWLCFRIKNAVLSLFCASEWQRTQKRLEKDLWNGFKAMKGPSGQLLITELSSQQQVSVRKKMNSLINNLLVSGVKIREAENKDDRVNSDKVHERAVSDLINAISNIVDEYFPHLKNTSALVATAAHNLLPPELSSNPIGRACISGVSSLAGWLFPISTQNQ